MATCFRPAAAFSAVCAVFLLSILCRQVPAAEPVTLPAADPLISIHEGFVDEKTCASCHPSQSAAFAKSHHAKAMALASDATVRADFDDARFEHDGIATSFFRRDGRYFVRTQGPEGKEADFEVKYTFGHEPLQQYLVALDGGRLQALDVAWDTRKTEWFWLGLAPPAKPGTTNHWTGSFYRWNRTCIDCHSTDPRPNFQPGTNTYDSSFVATSIGCQSCHGGGSEHVEWAEAKQQGSTVSSEPGLGLAPTDSRMCFACHSRRTKLQEAHGPGKTFLDYFSPVLLRPDLYFADGQILDEVFEYGSFQQSKMARAGVTCFDCHSAHEGTVKAKGNALCTQCHTEIAPERFTRFDPSGTYDTPRHTHHPMGSPGAACANCHMPERTYMKVDPRRDHSFVIPRPDLSIAYGTPNACTTCHQNETNAWAAESMDSWYDVGWRKRPTIAHAFAGAQANDHAAIEALRRLATDPEQAGIVRGSAITEMGRLGGGEVAADVKAATADSDPLVRLGAAQAADNLPPEQRQETIGDLLKDETRAVRVAAARALAAAISPDLPGRERSAFDAAVEDLRAYVEANADFAEVQSTYGLYMLDQRRPAEAEAAFRQAISLDAGFPGAHVNLAELFRATGQNEKSEKAYAEAIAISPDEPTLRYGHGLALVRMKALPGAIQEFQEAVRLDPGNSGYRTTLAVALDSVGRTEDAFAMLNQTLADGATDANLLGVAVQFGLKLRLYRETLAHAEALARLQPNDPRLAELISHLRATTKGGN